MQKKTLGNMGPTDLFLNSNKENQELMTLGKDDSFQPSFSGVLDGTMGVVAAGAPMIDNIGKSTNERMDDKGNITHKVNTGANVLSMGGAGAKLGAALGPGGALIGGLAGAGAGLIGSLIDGSNQPTLDDVVKKKKKFNLEMHTKTIASNDTFSQQAQAAKKGVKGMPNTKTIEVERDELVLRKTGKAFKKVADFKGGKLHEQGGEKYTADKGDIIIPKNKRLAVNQALRTRDWKRIESIRQSLPEDTTTIFRKGLKEYRRGTISVKTETPVTETNAYGHESIITTQNYIYNKLVDAGLDPIAAKGMVANLTYESDNFEALEEREPNKKGTRGLGIAQWTNSKNSPRRTAFESFLKERGVDASDLDANIEFLISELEGEQDYNVGTSIEDLNTHSGDIEEASMRVLTNFERPQDQSEDHNAKRLQRSQDFLTQKEIAPLYTPEGSDKPVQLSVEAYQAEIDKNKTPEQREFEKELKEGKLPYWNTGVGKGKAIADYKAARREHIRKASDDDFILGGVKSFVPKKILDWIPDSVEYAAIDLITGANVPERLRGMEMDEVGFEDSPKGKQLQTELDDFLYNTLAFGGDDVLSDIGNFGISTLEAFNALKDNVVSGQSISSATPNAIGNLGSWFEEDELQAIIDKEKDAGRLSPWAEHVIKDAYANPQNWYTEDMRTGFVFDMVTLAANPKGLYTLGKGGLKLVQKGAKGAKTGAELMAKTLKNASLKDLKKAPALVKKGLKSISTAMENGTYTFRTGESMDDLIATVDKIDNSGVPIAKSSRSMMDKMRATRDFFKTVPDRVRKSIVGKSFTEMQELRKSAEKLTGKSADELASMSRADVAELYQSGITKRLDAIEETTKAKGEAWDMFRNAKKEHKALLAEKKALENGKATPIAIGKIDDKIKAAEESLETVKSQITALKAQEHNAYKGVKDLGGFMDETLTSNWDSVRDLNKSVVDQLDVFDESDEFIKAAKKAEQTLTKSLDNLKTSKGDLKVDAINEVSKTIENTANSIEDFRGSAKTLQGVELAQKTDLNLYKKALGEKWKDFPELLNAIQKDKKALKALRDGTKTVAQIAATIEHAERKKPDSKIAQEIKKIQSMNPEDFPKGDVETAVKSEGLKPVGRQDDGTPAGPTVSADDEKLITDLDDGTPAGPTVSADDEKLITDLDESDLVKDMKKDYGEVGKKIGAAFEDLAAYAPAIYNIARGLEKPDKVKRRFVTPQTKKYENLSHGQMNIIDEAFNMSLSNARNNSGGLMSNFRSNAAKAWAEKIARTNEVNEFEAGRSNQIANENVAIRNDADRINTQTNQQADIVDMQSEAATKSFLAQGINDVANIASRNKRDRNANKNQNLVLFMMETPNFKFNKDTGSIDFMGQTTRTEEEDQLN